MKVEEVRQELMRLADEDYKAFHSRLLPGTENILGVRGSIRLRRGCNRR